jgi:hypothetical protein
VPKHVLLGGWYLRGLIAHQQRYQPSVSNEIIRYLTQIHNRSLTWLATGTSIKCGGVKLVLCISIKLTAVYTIVYSSNQWEFGFTLRDNVSPQTLPEYGSSLCSANRCLNVPAVWLWIPLGENKIIKNYKLKYLAVILLCWNIRHNMTSHTRAKSEVIHCHVRWNQIPTYMYYDKACGKVIYLSGRYIIYFYKLYLICVNVFNIYLLLWFAYLVFRLFYYKVITIFKYKEELFLNFMRWPNFRFLNF